LYEAANREIRTTTILLEEYEKQDFEQALGDAERALELNKELYKKKQAEYLVIQEELQDLNEQIIHTLRANQTNRSRWTRLGKLADTAGFYRKRNRFQTYGLTDRTRQD